MEEKSKYIPTPLEAIQRMRYFLLVHSCLYYRYNTTLVTDEKYDTVMRRLIQLNKEHPELLNEGMFAEYFKEFQTGDSFKLPYGLPHIVNKAEYLLRIDKLFRKN